MTGINTIGLLFFAKLLEKQHLESLDEWWDREEIARYLSVAPATVSSYIHRDEFPKFENFRGRKQVWRRSTVESWLNQRPHEVLMTDTVEVRKPDDPRELTARKTDGTFSRLTDPIATCGIIQARLDLCEKAHAITDAALRISTIPATETTDSTDELLEQANSLLRQAEELVQKAVVYQRQRKATWHSIGEILGTKAESTQRRYGKAEQDAKDRISRSALRAIEERQNQLAANLDNQNPTNEANTVQNGVKRLRFLATLDALQIEAESREKVLKDLHQAEQLQCIYEHLAALCRELFILDRNEIKWSYDADAMSNRANELRGYVRERSMKSSP